MDKRLIPWIAAAGLALGVAGVMASRQASPRAATVPSRIALIGDSYAVGLGPELAKLLPGFTYAGREGSSTAQWAQWLPGWVAGYQPTLTIVSLGVNGTPNSADFHAVVAALGGVGSRVVWIDPPAGVSVPGVNLSAIYQVIASLGVPVVPATTTPLRPEKIRDAVAYLHPQSYAPWAREIANAIG